MSQSPEKYRHNVWRALAHGQLKNKRTLRCAYRAAGSKLQTGLALFNALLPLIGHETEWTKRV